MNRFLGVLVVLVIVGAAIGFYRGWFSFATSSENHNANVTLSVDKDKIKEDTDKAKEKLENLENKVKDKISTPSSERK
jgi:hypothetical protein